MIANLSKGFQQRVGIAQAILHNPEVIILDEPTVGLDPIQIREIRALIRELGQDHGVILSTHILSEVQESCSHVQIIHQGQLILNESIAGLNQTMNTGMPQVTTRLAPDTSILLAIPGVSSIETLSENQIRIHHSITNDPNRAHCRNHYCRRLGTAGTHACKKIDGRYFYCLNPGQRFMNMILTIASREFKSLFLSPLAWTVLAILQCILAYLFLTQVETFTLIQPKLADY